MLLDKIKKLCKEKGITINKLEQLAGLSQRSIGKWDTSAPSADKLQRVADYFNVSTDYLLGRTDNPAPIEEVFALSSDTDYDDLPPEAVEEIERFKEFVRSKYKKNSD